MMNQKLLKNWIVLNSKTHSNKVYYFNTKTKQSSWEEPSAIQPEQITKKLTGSLKKCKNSVQEGYVSEILSKTPKQDVLETETNERKKLVAKRSIPKVQEKTNEEKKETPQMRTLREKIHKRKEKNNISKIQSLKNSKDSIKVTSSKINKTISLPLNFESDINTKITYTPQMQAILEKMQERNLNSTSKTKKIKQSVDNNSNRKQEEPIKPRRLRSQSMYQQNTVSEFSCTLQSKNKKDEQQTPSLATVEKSPTKKRTDDRSSVGTISTKRSQKTFKKNLGKERMEKLRKNLILENSKSETSECASCSSQSTASINKHVGKLPSIYKNAEVRLVRLKSRLSKNKNKSPCNVQSEKIEKLSEKSVTTVDDLANQFNEDSFYEEMDWEPMQDEKITFEVQAVRTQLCAENNTDISCSTFCNILNCSPLLEQQEKRQLYIVVDTNVFLSNIEAIELAKETTFKIYDQPVIVIPWTVIRELDYIKDDNGKTKSVTLCVKARKAVNYINKLFSSKHPRIIGQTREDVARNKEKFSIDCPDDEILQTCLQIRDFEKSVVLLSYDINLCNKAMVYDIMTLGRNDPFEKIDYLNATNYVNKSSSESNEQDTGRLSLNSVSILNQKQCVADEILDDAKNVIRDFLTVVISKEMRSLYGDSWEKYVIIQPPWTIVTVLQCAIKHWIAAVSESFLRKAEAILKELLEVFKNVSGELTLKDVSYIVDKCNDVIQMANIDKYPDLMPRISQKIDELRQKCRNFESLVIDHELCDAIGVENNVAERERRAQKAFRYFEEAYIFARDMCGLAAEAVRMPCSFHYTIPNPLPPLDYIKQIQPELAANVNRLLHTLSAVIEQVKDSSTNYRTVKNLYQSLITFLPESESIRMKLTNDDLAPLDVYCCVKQKKEVLETGLRQLQELSTHFCRLASYRCT
ncbi:swt1 RNA endoribonuclease [Ptiloglossa arizonensis]|uniref:swt1 RNA endoribonuclease n=1 Tax=Ptiloglossa arizonensis TaxID=3350558 RepID=UPI003F9F4692